jgi:hypothetical protein
MFEKCYRFLPFLALVAIIGVACTKSDSASSSNTSPTAKFTPSDVAKLKWIEGTWRGMVGDKPFFERYTIENDAMIVEGFEDGSFAKSNDTTRFELKNGEFGSGEGEQRSVATSITDNAVQFIPAVAGKGNRFRFERQTDGTWNAILEWLATNDKPARQKIYKMEPWKPGQSQ